MEQLARDVFDLAVALSLDQAAFQQAASLCLPADADLLIDEIRGTAGTYRRTAPISIKLADPQWAELVDRAPEEVADALERQLPAKPPPLRVTQLPSLDHPMLGQELANGLISPQRLRIGKATMSAPFHNV